MLAAASWKISSISPAMTFITKLATVTKGSDAKAAKLAQSAVAHLNGSKACLSNPKNSRTSSRSDAFLRSHIFSTVTNLRCNAEVAPKIWSRVNLRRSEYPEWNPILDAVAFSGRALGRSSCNYRVKSEVRGMTSHKHSCLHVEAHHESELLGRLQCRGPGAANLMLQIQIHIRAHFDSCFTH